MLFHALNHLPGIQVSSGPLRLKIGNLIISTKKLGLTIHKLMYDEHLIKYSEALKVARTEYYSQIISDGATNPKMVKTINKILKQKSPICSSVQQSLSVSLWKRLRTFICLSALSLCL